MNEEGSGRRRPRGAGVCFGGSPTSLALGLLALVLVTAPAGARLPAPASQPATASTSDAALQGSRSRTESIAALLELLTSSTRTAREVVDAGAVVAADPSIAADPELLSLALSVQCRGHYRLSELAAAQRSCDAAAATSQRDLARFAVLRMQGTLVAERGQPTQAIPLFLDSLDAATRSENSLAVAAALGNLGAVAQFAGANAEAVDYYDRAWVIATRIGAIGLQATLGSNLGYLLVEAGKADLARETFGKALVAARQAGNSQAEFTSLNGLAHAQLAAGEADQAAAALRGLLEAAGPYVDTYQLAEGQLFLARAELAAGHPLAAETAARASIEGLEGHRPLRAYPAYAVLIDALVANGSLAEAAAKSSRFMGLVPETARGRFELLKARARLLAATRRHEEAYAVLLESDRVREAQSIARAEDRLAFMRARNEAREREGELARLREQQGQIAARAERDRLVRNFSLALAFLGGSGVALYWSTVRTRRRLEAQIARRQQVEALGKLTGGVAHDFNNLMTIVRQAMGLLRRQPALRESPEMRMLVEEADGAAQLGGEITQRLLSFARQQPMKPEIVDVAAFIDRQRPLLERSLGPSMELAIRLEPGVGAIRVDPAQLMAALINLLVNARDAMDGRGVVSLSVATADNSGRNPHALDLPVGRYVEISVVDSGRGMTPEILRQAVTPFFTTKEESGGAGLGLSSVDGFVNQSGGALQLRSEPGKGTAARAFFPQVMHAAGRVTAASGDEAVSSPAGSP